MGIKRACILCNKEIPNCLGGIKYDDFIFDSYGCVTTFKKLKAAFGDLVQFK
ncbi:MAG: hypothetical protein WBP84_02615 [Nitrososphaeraceae archaeon]|jgi:hypothetical protein